MSEIASKTLGSSASYAVYTEQFDPSLLNPMPRKLARDSWNMTGDEFDGVDVWRCHEATFLLNSGKPVSGTLKFVYPASSEFMVESKSMKLYLNTFDMCRMGSTYEEAVTNYKNQVKTDLEAILGAEVGVAFFGPLDVVHVVDSAFTPETYLDDLISDSVEFDDFKAERSHIELTEYNNVSGAYQRWFTNSLRSRCRETRQKDTGSGYFVISHEKLINPASLMRQVVSLREVNEFHEFCAEKLFVEIQNAINPQSQSVALLYARRGSLDINPMRWSKNLSGEPNQYIGSDLLIKRIANPNINANKVFGQ